MRTLSLLTVAVVVLGLVPGCKKKQPSEDFTQASTAFAALYGAKLDDAYVDPKMDGILEQLRRVPEDSTDTEAAKQLIARIESGRAARIAAASARENATAEMLKAPVVPFNPTTPTNQNTPPPTVTPTVDAGPAKPTAPRIGMTSAEFDKNFGDCFEAGITIQLEGAGSGTAETKSMRDRNFCRDRLPGFDGKLVVFQNGLVVNIMNKTELRPVTVRQDGGMFDVGQ